MSTREGLRFGPLPASLDTSDTPPAQPHGSSVASQKKKEGTECKPWISYAMNNTNFLPAFFQKSFCEILVLDCWVILRKS
jgi:hypothetical protein